MVRSAGLRAARSGRRDGIIETVFAGIFFAGAGVGRELVDGKKCDAFAVEQNVLRAVAVMHVEIKNGDALESGSLAPPKRGEGWGEGI